MSLTLPTWISAIATLGLLIGAGLTVYFAGKAFNAQSEQLRDQQSVNQRQTVVLDLQAKELQASLIARQEATALLRQEHASTIAAWLDEPQTAKVGWLVVGHVHNSGERPIRDVSAHWYANGSPILERAQLAACLLAHDRRDFECRVDTDTIRTGTLKAVVRFRTLGDDWWSVGTDGQLTQIIGSTTDSWPSQQNM
jgi:hypothetical protein